MFFKRFMFLVQTHYQDQRFDILRAFLVKTKTKDFISVKRHDDDLQTKLIDILNNFLSPVLHSNTANEAYKDFSIRIVSDGAWSDIYYYLTTTQNEKNIPLKEVKTSLVLPIFNGHILD